MRVNQHEYGQKLGVTRIRSKLECLTSTSTLAGENSMVSGNGGGGGGEKGRNLKNLYCK